MLLILNGVAHLLSCTNLSREHSLPCLEHLRIHGIGVQLQGQTDGFVGAIIVVFDLFGDYIYKGILALAALIKG